MQISRGLLVRMVLFGITVQAMMRPPAGVSQQLQGPKVGGESSFDPSADTSPRSNSNARKALSAPSALPEDFSTLMIAPGFLLSMEIYDAPEWNNDIRVDPSGDISVPIVGKVHVAGETADSAAHLVADRLVADKILKNPQVTLNIEQYAGLNITLLGEVRSPGRIELLSSHTLADVIALGGGATLYAGSFIEIQHKNGSKTNIERTGSAVVTEDPKLMRVMVEPGDSITISRAGIVYVLGGVNRPGGYIMQDGGRLNVTQALSLAFGTELNSAVNSMWLVRKDSEGKLHEIPIAYRKVMKGKIASPQLQAGDVLYVPISKVRTALSASLLNAAATAAIYYR